VREVNTVYLAEHIKGEMFMIDLNFCYKLHDRKVLLSKASFTSESARKEWEDVLTVELMSSKESNVGDNGKEILIVHRIPWLSDIVAHFRCSSPET